MNSVMVFSRRVSVLGSGVLCTMAVTFSMTRKVIVVSTIAKVLCAMGRGDWCVCV